MVPRSEPGAVNRVRQPFVNLRRSSTATLSLLARLFRRVPMKFPAR